MGENLSSTFHAKVKFSNTNYLNQTLTEEWPKISLEICQNLVESIPRRLMAVIDAEGMDIPSITNICLFE